VIHTLPEAKIISRVILPDEEKAPTFVDRMLANLESTNPSTNLFVRLCMAVLKQLQQHYMFILSYNTNQWGFTVSKYWLQLLQHQERNRLPKNESILN